MLVTVIVVTFNSSKYVLQTLESVYRQSYRDIELIISDDCSTDDTFNLCRLWVDSHRDRFVKALTVQTQHNSGICQNYNYSLGFASGEYIKYIAGDDILENNCIEVFVNRISPDIFLYTCTLAHLRDETGEMEYYQTRVPNLSAKQQARFMLRFLYGINGPTIFIHRKKLLELGGFDEQFSFVEDLPISLKLTTNGYRIGIVPEVLVRWRIYGDSISHSNHTFAVSLREAIYYYTQKYCLRFGLPLHQYHHWLNHWLIVRDEKGKSRWLGYFLRLFDLVNLKRKLFPIPSEPYQKVDI